MDIETRNNNHEIFAPLKDKWLVNKPEEQVRQKYICRLVDSYGYSLDQMAQCGQETAESGSILNEKDLRANLAINCIPEDIFEIDYTRYDDFLAKRRSLMAKKNPQVLRAFINSSQ